MSHWRSLSSRALGYAIILVLFCQACAETLEATCESQGNCAPEEARPAPGDAGAPSAADRDAGMIPVDSGLSTDAASNPTDAMTPSESDAGSDGGEVLDASSPMDAEPPVMDASPPDVDGAIPEDRVCFSPTQNVDRAYEADAYGCACEMTRPNRAGYCMRHSGGTNVALMCNDGKWIAVADGPCWPPALITLAMCAQRSGELVIPMDTDASIVHVCPDGRQMVGVLTTEEGDVREAPCCKK